MNIKEVKELVKLLDGTDVTELALENEGSKIVIKKGHAGVTHMVSPAQMMSMAPAVHAGHASAPAAPAVEEKGDGLGPNQVLITSPMIGTFYRAPGPESDPYVQSGQLIEVGQVVCIIEAMKLMNEIESEWRGKIAQILVENAQPVEFGQPLFVLEKV
jgi:acetyl-CoA carboxylase biotin carboxyl carrier protein